jgi:hypothetical protein
MDSRRPKYLPLIDWGVILITQLVAAGVIKETNRFAARNMPATKHILNVLFSKVSGIKNIRLSKILERKAENVIIDFLLPSLSRINGEKSITTPVRVGIAPTIPFT